MLIIITSSDPSYSLPESVKLSGQSQFADASNCWKSTELAALMDGNQVHLPRVATASQKNDFKLVTSHN